MAQSSLSLTYQLSYAPQPSILRGIAAFEQSLKGSVVREGEPGGLPVKLRDRDGSHHIEIGAESFSLTVEPLTRIDRFGPSAVSLSSQFVKRTRSVSPREVELRAVLRIPVPDLNRLLAAYSVAAFSRPRKIELRPEALGKDHFIPCETGMVHLRLATHQLASGHWISLMVANRHDRVSPEEGVLEQAYALCLQGVRNVVSGVASPLYRQALAGLIAPIPGVK
jgi:hypothetical protein